MKTGDDPRMTAGGSSHRWRWAGLLAVVVVGLSCVSAQAADDQTGGVTFAQVLASPDDVGLNFDYARSEAQAGNLLNAAAAMERVIASRPDWAPARLFYAGLLYRLDDMQDARTQLWLLNDRNLNRQQRQEADDYRRKVGPGGFRP